MNVSLFITCLTDSFYPRVGIAVVKVLEHFGCVVDFPSAQTCCGQPMYNNGFHEDARELARRMVRVFESSEYVVTPSGSCAAMVRDYYPELLEGDHAYEEGARAFAGKTYEFAEFMVKVLKADLRPLRLRYPGKMTYHYSCHLRGLGAPPWDSHATAILKQIEGVEYVPLEKAEQCCGFGGTFAINFPQVSDSLVRDKIECVRATGAETIMVNDAGCAMNIAGACRRHELPIRFTSLPEILAESLGLLEPSGGAVLS